MYVCTLCIYVFSYILLHWVFDAVHGLSLAVLSRDHSLVVYGFLTVAASLILEHGL